MRNPCLFSSILLFICIFQFGCTSNSAPPTPIAPLFDGLTGHEMRITTSVPSAQTYFTQGLLLSFGFNHAEAARSFREAIRQDPTCAMCYWGLAYALGPNYNSGMDDTNVPEAYKAAQQAQKFADSATEWEKSLVKAIVARYVEAPIEDRSALDIAYADELRIAAKQHPQNADVKTFLGEALMNLHPWDLYKKNGAQQPWTEEILTELESALALAPKHPAANHMYIHAVESSSQPEIGRKSAKILLDQVPGAGHLVHMASHIYIRTGQYHEGSISNERAILADSAYVTKCHSQDLYPLAYYPHNWHFLAATAALEGRGEVAMNAAFQVQNNVNKEMMREPGMGTLQHYLMIPLYVMVKFAQWDQILEQPKPDEDLKYPRGVWHYAQGMAFSAKGDLDLAKKSLAALSKLSDDPAIAEVSVWDINNVSNLLEIAELVLKAEIAESEGDLNMAISALEKAVELEDQLNYNEPPDWFFSVRHALGAVLNRAKKYAEAEKVFQQDLAWMPANGWALNGLYESLLKQNKPENAAKIKVEFEKAWQWADIDLNDSRVNELTVKKYQRYWKWDKLYASRYVPPALVSQNLCGQ